MSWELTIGRQAVTVRLRGWVLWADLDEEVLRAALLPLAYPCAVLIHTRGKRSLAAPYATWAALDLLRSSHGTGNGRLLGALRDAIRLGATPEGVHLLFREGALVDALCAVAA